MNDYDLIIIGGGLNGASIAADAAGRGLRVVLVEARDLPSPTTELASGLLLGGLRHLQRLDLELAIRSIREQKILLRRAPHLLRIRPIVLVEDPQQPDALRQGRLLALLSWLSGRGLGQSERIDLARHAYGAALKHSYRNAVVYHDCSGDATRLVLANARLAASLGAELCGHTRVVRLARDDDAWRVELEDCDSYQRRQLRARALINTSGRYTNELLRQHFGQECRARSRMIKVTSMLCSPLYDGDQVYMLTAPGGHRVCINPLPNGLHLVGAAQQEYAGDGVDLRPDQQEIDWLLDVVNRHFSDRLDATGIVRAYCGLLPVADEPGKSVLRTARNFVLDLDCPECRTPLLQAYGGRMVIARRMAEAALEMLRPWLPQAGDRWTAHSLLPGAALPDGGTDALAAQLQASCPELAPEEIQRLVRSYGSEAWHVISPNGTQPQPGARIGGHFHESELRYLVGKEWLRNVDDLIWRRTDVGPLIDAGQRDELARWLASNQSAHTPE